MKSLPDGLCSYARTREFTEQSIPDSFSRSHRTRAGTWARIVIAQGTLRYRILEPEIEEILLSTDKPGIVEPEVAHQVEPRGLVRFYLEFYH